jgi:hypothetical protein
MIICTADKAGRILSLSYGKHVGVHDMYRCLETVRELMQRLKPGFVILSDLSHLESMDPACAQPLGLLMDLCSAGGVSLVVRVMPDPTKDIGFNIISHFHMRPPVGIESQETLADAIHSLAEHFEAARA